MAARVKHRRRGYPGQHQAPGDALGGRLQRAGIRTGDTLRAEVRGPGEVLLVRDADPVVQFAGALTGVYASGELDRLRDEWD